MRFFHFSWSEPLVYDSMSVTSGRQYLRELLPLTMLYIFAAPMIMVP